MMEDKSLTDAIGWAIERLEADFEMNYAEQKRTALGLRRALRGQYDSQIDIWATARDQSQ